MPHWQSSKIALWGCSATLRRHDGLSLGKAFEAITYHKSLLELMQSGYLAPMRVFSVRTHLDLSSVGVSSSGGLERDFVLAQLASAVNTPARNTLVVDKWLEIAQQGSHGRRLSTLVFAVDLQHVRDLLDAFAKRDVHAESVDGGTPSDQRADILRRFRERKFPVLVNCAVLTEGTDIPSIDCVVMARPTRSSVLFQQMIGRGLRTFAGFLT